MGGKEIRRQYFCVCDGQQEEMYLKHLAHLLKTEVRRVSFTTKRGLPGDITKHRHIKYDKAVLFDHDGKTNEFREALITCHKAKCTPAYSNLNFDLWLLLHKQDYTSHESTNKAYVNRVRKAYNLGDETDIKSKASITTILKQITLDDIKSAIRRAQKIREQKLTSDAEKIGLIICYDNPDLSIHKFILKMFSECEEPLVYI